MYSLHTFLSQNAIWDAGSRLPVAPSPGAAARDATAVITARCMSACFSFASWRSRAKALLSARAACSVITINPVAYKRMSQRAARLRKHT